MVRIEETTNYDDKDLSLIKNFSRHRPVNKKNRNCYETWWKRSV